MTKIVDNKDDGSIIYVTDNRLYDVSIGMDKESGDVIYVVTHLEHSVIEHRTQVLIDALATARYLDKKVNAFFTDIADATGEFDGILAASLNLPDDDGGIH